MRRYGRMAASLAGAVLLWEAVAWAGFVPAEYFPPPHEVALVLGRTLASGELSAAWALTFARALAGLAGATAIALAVALLTARYPLARRAFDPVAEFFRPLPPAALVPVSIFFLGLGWKLYAFILVFTCFWPVYLNAAAGLAAVPRVQLATAASFGYREWALLVSVRLPAALPEVFIGVRLAAAVSLIATFVAEMLAGRDGLGFTMAEAAFTLRIPETFACLVVAMVSGIAMNALVVAARRAACGWHERLAALHPE